MLRGEKIKKIFTTIFIVILTLIPLSLCFNRSVWLDEAFSLRWSMLPFASFVNRITLDVCPLYLLVLRIVLTITNNSLLAAKLFSVLAVFLIFIMGLRFIRKEFGYKAMVFYCLFILFTPMMLKKSVEVRTYTWTFLLVSLSCVQMYYLLKSSCTRKNWILFTVTSLAAAYTHYFAVLSLVVVYAGLLIFYLLTHNIKQIKAWLVCAVCTVIIYLPWVPIILRQSKSETTSWIPISTSRLGIMRNMFWSGIPRLENVYILLLIIFLIMGIILFCRLKTADLYWSVVCMSTVWVILVFGLFCEKTFRPILVDKYLMIPLCISIMGMSYICKYIPKYLLCLPCLLFVITGFSVYPVVYAEEYNTLTDTTLQFVDENVHEGDIIVYDSGSLCSVIPYYFPNILDRGVETYDIYSEDYDYLWYFATEDTLDPKKLKENNIQCIDYGMYGFDLNFTIYYLYQAED